MTEFTFSSLSISGKENLRAMMLFHPLFLLRLLCLSFSSPFSTIQLAFVEESPKVAIKEREKKLFFQLLLTNYVGKCDWEKSKEKRKIMKGTCLHLPIVLRFALLGEWFLRSIDE